jgi:outer membrane protein OmpA-like peptidoglycan-associated protein
LRTACLSICVLGLFAAPRAASAEPVLIALEGQAALALTQPQSDLFGPGASAALSLRIALAAELLIGAELRGGFLSDGPAPRDFTREDPGAGSFELGMLLVRVRPLARLDGSGPQRSVGLFADFGGGGGITGKDARPGFQGGLGYGIGLGAGFAIAPTVRYLQVIQPAHPLSSADARLLMFGVELSAFDVARTHAKLQPELPSELPPPPPMAAAPAPAKLVPASDRDHDGVYDDRDGCPDAPEDRDGFADDDGCAELDNDKDEIPDVSDRCPDQAEVVNGNEDTDGCPDEGLIVFEHDRIVLEERVLFDSERARVKHKGRDVLAAVVKLIRQHPEWALLRVEGHADKRGVERFNQELSERRARNVRKVMIELGVPAEQIESAGFGSTRLRDRRGGEEADQRNRRVEFVVVGRRAPEKGAGR